MCKQRVTSIVEKILEGDLVGAQDLLTAEMDERRDEAIAESKAAITESIRIQ